MVVCYFSDVSVDSEKKKMKGSLALPTRIQLCLVLKLHWNYVDVIVALMWHYHIA